jgi:hypothetical protein
MPWVARETPAGSRRWRAVNEPRRPHPAAAPPIDCGVCGRRIGKHATHFLLDDRRVVCGRCYRAGGEPLWEQLDSMGTRAGVAHVVGLWP